MKLNVINNNAFDLSSISVLPPRTSIGLGGGDNGRVGAPAASAASRHQQPQTLLRQQSFSQRGGGGASLPHSQLSEASHGDSLSAPARDQRSGLHDHSSKRPTSFPPSSASCAREESQLQQAKISNDAIHRWNPSLTDSRCQTANEDVERKFQQLASSVHKVEMVLDLVQNDVIQLNRAMKEASLDSGSIQQKVALLENPLQQILKGGEGLKALLKDSIRNNSNQLSVSNSRTSKLNEISSILTAWPEQVQADIGQLHGDILRIFTKEMEDQGHSCNGGLQRNQVVVENGMPLVNQTPVANLRPQMDQTLVANGRLQMDQTPVASGRPHKDQITATKFLPSPLINSTKTANPKPNVEQGNVKATLRNRKVNPQLPSKKAPVSITIDSDDGSEGCASSAVSNTGPADVMKEATSKEGLRILRMPRSRKKKRREMQQSVAAKALLADAQSEADDEQEVADEAAAPPPTKKRHRRPNSKYDSSQWAT